VSLLEIKDKVQRYLMDMGIHGIEVVPDTCSFRMGSTRVFIEVEERGEDESKFTVIRILAPIVSNLTASPELFECVARNADDWLFGHLGLIEDEESKTFQMVFTHRLLADYSTRRS
jgi:hypothetical protein